MTGWIIFFQSDRLLFTSLESTMERSQLTLHIFVHDIFVFQKETGEPVLFSDAAILYINAKLTREFVFSTALECCC